MKTAEELLDDISLGPSDKIRLLDFPVALPAQCASCNTNSNMVKYFYFGVDIDYYGAVYICTNCIIIFANSLHYVTKDQFDSIISALMTTQEELDRKNKENEHLRSLLSCFVGSPIGNSPDGSKYLFPPSLPKELQDTFRQIIEESRGDVDKGTELSSRTETENKPSISKPVQL